MVDFIAKPVDFRELVRALRLYLKPGEPPGQLATAVAGPRPVDEAAALAVIQGLMPLLAEHKFDAFAAFKELKSLLDGTVAEDEIAEIGLLLNRMAFEQVGERLNQLLVSWGRSLSE